MIIERFVRDYLSNKLDVPVYTEIPAKPEDSFVLVEKTGSSRENTVITSNLSLKSHGKTLEQASELNEVVKEAILEIVEADAIASVLIETDYNFTDTSTKRYRYQAVIDLVHF